MKVDQLDVDFFCKKHVRNMNLTILIMLWLSANECLAQILKEITKSGELSTLAETTVSRIKVEKHAVNIARVIFQMKFF